MKNVYERIRTLQARADRARAGGKPSDKVSPEPLAKHRFHLDLVYRDCCAVCGMTENHSNHKI